MKPTTFICPCCKKERKESEKVWAMGICTNCYFTMKGGK